MKAECAPDGANNEHEAQAGGEVINLSDALSREQAGNAARHPRMWNDAEVLGDLDAPEAQAVLAMPLAMLGAASNKMPGPKWNALEMSVETLLENILSRHPVTPKKHGDALVYARSVPTGKTFTKNGVKHAYAYRLKDKIQEITAFFADVDGTDMARRVAGRIHDLGLFGVIYTTHSHAAKKTETGDRFRVVIFLEKPFQFPADGAARREAVARYHRHYAGMCELLGLDEIDASGMKLNQMMYAPRRASEDAAFEHYVIAGQALRIEDMPEGDPSKYKNEGAGGGVSRNTAKDSGEPAYLSDGFDVRAWFQDHGEAFDVETFLAMLGWDERGDANGGQVILCPNDAAHSNPGDTGDAACWTHGGDGEKAFVITCQHDHCAHLCTWDFVKLIEDNIFDGVFALSDEYEHLSDLICDPICYPEIDGETVEVRRADYVDEEIKVGWTKTPIAVRKAFNALGPNAGDDHFAAIFASICNANSPASAVKKWGELIAGHYGANDRKRIEKRGRDLLAESRKAYAAEKGAERQEELAQALTRADLANPSLDPAEPLGDTLEEALATLGKRYAPVDLGGKFRIVRKPDLGAFVSETDSTIIVYQKSDFLDLHLDRQLTEGDGLVNPAKTFLETEKRKSGLVFAPPPQVAGSNDFNMYLGRKRAAKVGGHGDARDFPTIYAFIRDIVCDGDPDKLEWLTLWMAHMVQRPGEKPGTAVVGIGKGGVGKGTFGKLLAQLTLPHFKQLEDEAHVTGQFAGEHLSKCILVVVNEAVFGLSHKVSSKLKALVDSDDIQVEAKGMNLTTVRSFTRFYFDSNDAVPVMIEGNGSERRYFVIRFSEAQKQNKAYFNALNAAIDGDEMAALLAYLEAYDPADAGLDWADVRTAPETPERLEMGVNSLSGPMLRLKEVLEEGEVTLMTPEGAETFSDGAKGLKVPVALFREYIGAAGRKDRAEDRDVPAMFARLCPGVELGEGQGAVGSEDNKRWWRFPPECLGVTPEGKAVA